MKKNVCCYAVARVLINLLVLVPRYAKRPIGPVQDNPSLGNDPIEFTFKIRNGNARVSENTSTCESNLISLK